MLTPEQQAIVDHATGPALVFAVAGAGKTTSMVHRIRRLVREDGVDPGAILASSFSRATVQDIDTALRHLGVSGVDVRTLHSLAFRIVRQAERRGHLPPRTQSQEEDPASLARILATRALTGLAMKREVDTSDLGIDRDELLDQISAWKQQLRFPNVDRLGLPPEARADAGPAEHDNEDVLTLYETYESIRTEEGWLTYDDMLVEAWTALHRYDDLRADAQARYQHVLIDEFQDVSRVQYLLLDRLTEPHRNYMAIGDDDQCIYEWRGANPSFILDFEDAYDADTYVITDNFRCTPGQIALGNAVIQQNDTRREKSLHATRPFQGDTRLIDTGGPRDEAETIVDAVETLQEDGFSLNEAVILVRTYAQTPFLESVLIHREIPYRIVGHVPFYRRREVKTLLQYLYWAILEKRRDATGWFDTRREAARYVDRFTRILKEPNRYVKHDLIDRIASRSVREKTSVLDVLSAMLYRMHDRTADRVETFLDTAEALVQRLDDPADETLDWLIDALDYEAYLRNRSAIAEIGEARARTARSLVAFAEGHDSVASLLQEIVSISRTRVGDTDDEPVLEIRSIHRAKGAEWPAVFVPGCNDGVLPQRLTKTGASSSRRSGPASFSGSDDAPEPVEIDEEEECRLLYVAVTRAQERLILTYDRRDDLSPFLEAADAEALLAQVRRVRTRWQTDPATWSDRDVAHVVRGLDALGMERFLERWWSPDAERLQALQARLSDAASAVENARAVQADYEAACSAARDNAESSAQDADEDDARAVLASLRDTLGNAGIPIENEHSGTYFDADATFTFTHDDEADTVVAHHDGERVGTVDFFRSSRLAPHHLTTLPWDVLVGTYSRVGRGRNVVFATIDWDATEQALGPPPPDETPSPDLPEPPDESIQTLADDAVHRGIHRLLQAIQTQRTTPSHRDEAPATAEG